MNRRPAPADPFAGLDAGMRAEAVQAMRAMQSGRASHARRHFERLLARVPGHPGLLRLTAISQRMSGHIEASLATVRQAMAAAPDDDLLVSDLAQCLLAAGQTEAAIAALRRASEMAPDTAGHWLNLGNTLLKHGRAGEAVPALQRALALQGDALAPRVSLAQALAACGDITGSAEHCRAALRIDPGLGDAWIGLAALKAKLLTDADVARMQAALANPAITADNRLRILAALGQALHERGRYAEAFHAWQQANAMVRTRTPWHAADFARFAQALQQAPWPVPAPEPERPARAIFVVGPPRSGTSIACQMLAMHSQAGSCGESPLLYQLAQAMQHRQGCTLEALATRLQPAQWRALGDEYLERAGKLAGGAPVVVNKQLDNWLFAGLILSMLPDARIIVCLRDPLENAFSCWRHFFEDGAQPFTCDFAALAAQRQVFEQASRHWIERYPKRVTLSRHEELVADPEAGMRRLLVFCGLPFEEACLHPERSDQALRTASAAQVRQPVRPSLPEAQHYGALLDPLRAALAAHNLPLAAHHD